MITIITIFYIFCVYLAFRVIKIKASPVSVAVAAVIGVFILGGIVIGWQQSAPMTGQVVLVRRVLQVSTDVREFITDVHVEADQLVKKGDPLFEVSPDRYQFAVDQATAELAAAKSTVSQLEAALMAAQVAVKKSEAESAKAKAVFDDAVAIQKSSAGAAIAKLRVIQAQDGYRAAQADDKVAKASLKQAQYSMAAAKHSVDVSQAALETANFNLQQCSYTSPVDGRVMNWQVREQTATSRWRFEAVGTVEDLSRTVVAAVSPQNLLKNVEPGNVVEVAFKRVPGRVATGKVLAVVKYTGEGQLLPSGVLPEAASFGSKGFLVARIQLDDEELAKKMPLGAAGNAAIYTNHGKPFHVISKIALRIKGWMYYLPM